MKCQMTEEYSGWGTWDWQDDRRAYDWMWHWLEQEERCWGSLRSETSVYPLCWSFHPINTQKHENKENENEVGGYFVSCFCLTFDLTDLPVIKLNVDLLWCYQYAWQEIQQDSCPSEQIQLLLDNASDRRYPVKFKNKWTIQQTCQKHAVNYANIL